MLIGVKVLVFNFSSTFVVRVYYGTFMISDESHFTCSVWRGLEAIKSPNKSKSPLILSRGLTEQAHSRLWFLP